MDLENKISALKDFASFGSSSKGGPSSTRSNQSPQSTNSFSPQNGWGNWFAKGEKDPFLPSLVSFYKSMGSRWAVYVPFCVTRHKFAYTSIFFSSFSIFLRRILSINIIVAELWKREIVIDFTDFLMLYFPAF